MIEIDDHLLRRFEAEVAQRNCRAFAAWWRGRADVLPQWDDARLEQLWRHVIAEAMELGIEDDEEGRISLYAAAFALLGEMDGIQFLRVSDLLFEPGSADARLPVLIRMARTGTAD